MITTSLSRVTILGAALLLGSAALPAQPDSTWLRLDHVTRVADPKLPGGAAQYAVHLESGRASTLVSCEVLQGSSIIAQPWSGVLTDDSVRLVSWDGRDNLGLRCSTGTYTVRFSAPGQHNVNLPLDLVRLGVTEIEAQASSMGNDEFPMVYFRKSSNYEFFATPQIHEYANLAAAGEVSDLDYNSGEPRPPVPLHTATDAPVLDGNNYATTTYNYPLAYVMGSSPTLELTWGSTGTDANGAPMAAGYPTASHDLRSVLTVNGTEIVSTVITPGGTSSLSLPSLPPEVCRTDWIASVRWQAAPTGTSDWQDIPGQHPIALRFYTLLGPPVWKAGAPNTTRYAGPWVEVADFISHWKSTLAMPTHSQRKLTDVFVKGFFGQNGGLETAIEGVLYDCPSLGGDGGATHYFNTGPWDMHLSRLLNDHANGIFVNCTDNMGATTTMLSMMGCTNMQPVQLGSMSLKAIWGIGAPEYTTDLWGSGNHGFSYHHIVTDKNGLSVSDTCMQLDEDGNPNEVPGFPGWNNHRNWKDPSTGYNFLSCFNSPKKTVQALPGIQ